MYPLLLYKPIQSEYICIFNPLTFYIFYSPLWQKNDIEQGYKHCLEPRICKYVSIPLDRLLSSGKYEPTETPAFKALRAFECRVLCFLRIFYLLCSNNFTSLKIIP